MRMCEEWGWGVRCEGVKSEGVRSAMGWGV